MTKIVQYGLFKQNGNAFGQDAILGTIDAFPLRIYVNNTNLASFTVSQFESSLNIELLNDDTYLTIGGGRHLIGYDSASSYTVVGDETRSEFLKLIAKDGDSRIRIEKEIYYSSDAHYFNNTVDATVFSITSGVVTSVGTFISQVSTTTPLIIGGTSPTSTLRFRTTSGISTTGADFIWQSGNNGATELMRLVNGGVLVVGSATPYNAALNMISARRSSNGGNEISVQNTSGGASAYAAFVASNDVSQNLYMYMTSSGYTTNGGIIANRAIISTFNTGGIAMLANNPSGTIRFFTSSNSAERLSILSTGFVGINNSTAPNRLSVNTLTTADATAVFALSTGATTSKGVLIQGVASQTANPFQYSSSTGVEMVSFTANGSLNINNAVATIKIGTNDIVGYQSGILKFGDIHGGDNTVMLSGWSEVSQILLNDAEITYTCGLGDGNHYMQGHLNVSKGVSISGTVTPSNALLINTNFTQDTGLFNNAISIVSENNQTTGVGVIIGLNINVIQKSTAGAIPAAVSILSRTTLASAGTVFPGFFVGASFVMETTSAQIGTVADASVIQVEAPIYSGSKPTTNIGVNILNQGTSGVTFSAALNIQQQSGSTNSIGFLSYLNKNGLGNTTIPRNYLEINSLAVSDTLAQLAISTAATTNKGAVIQMLSGQTANPFEIQIFSGTAVVFADSSGNWKLKNRGAGFYISEGGVNAMMGTATLVAGTITVNTTKVTATSRIQLTSNANGGTEYGHLRVSARVAGTSFTITSYRGNNTTTVAANDTSVVSWIIFEPS